MPCRQLVGGTSSRNRHPEAGGRSHVGFIVEVMKDTWSHDFGAHGERERPTRAEALVQLAAITVARALEDLEFTLTDRRMEGASTLAVDMPRVRDLTPATVAALLWISRCTQARGVTFELHNASPRILGASGTWASPPPSPHAALGQRRRDRRATYTDPSGERGPSCARPRQRHLRHLRPDHHRHPAALGSTMSHTPLPTSSTLDRARRAF